jgi:hypothetical protein
MSFWKLGAVALFTLTVFLPSGARAQEFTNTEPSCAVYAEWIVDLMRKGQRAGCDFSKDTFDPKAHLKWCMGQSAARMRNAVEISRGHLGEKCARRGIDSRKIR